MNKDIILRFDNIHKSFASNKVLEGVSFEVERGKILGLCGENGAGKSTLMNILGGVIKKTDGQMFYNEEPYEPKTPMDARKCGISFIHQELNLFSNLSIVENFFIEEFPTRLGMIQKQKMNSITREALDRIGLDCSPNVKVENLSIGSRQMVEIAKAIKDNAKIIIFDEPTTSLSNKEKETLFKIIKELQENGTTIIYISHILEDVFRLTDSIVVLRDGKMISQKPTAETNKEEVVKMMVGRELTQLYPYEPREIGDIIFKAKNICNNDMGIKNSFELRKGEILGFFGLMGAGRSELMRAIFGVDKKYGGSIEINDKELCNLSPEVCINNGMAFVTENRREEGIVARRTISSNLVLSNLRALCKSGVLQNRALRSVTNDAVDTMRIKTFNAEKQTAGSLSGGNQQKVVLGKWLIGKPSVFIMDEPTRGIDVGAKYEIYQKINSLAKEKAAIIVVSSEMDELMGICDRILVMSNGEITGELQRSEFNSEKLLRYAMGEKNGNS